MLDLSLAIKLCGLSAVVGYCLAAVLLLPANMTSNYGRALMLGKFAAALHFCAVGLAILLHQSVSISFFDAFSLTALIVVLVTFITQMNLHAPTLISPVFLFSALAVAVSLLWGDHVPIVTHSSGMLLHIIFSITAYALLCLAALQAIAVYWVDKSLKHKTRPKWQKALPSLQSMEIQLFRLVDVGWLALTVAIVTGLLFIDDIFAQHLIHKTVFSSISWLLFGAFMLGRQLAGWRGVTAVKWTLGAFAALVLAYFGSKFVLDIILQTF
jgi:ABC-type uncharacterized transport system permease subunit